MASYNIKVPVSSLKFQNDGVHYEKKIFRTYRCGEIPSEIIRQLNFDVRLRINFSADGGIDTFDFESDQDFDMVLNRIYPYYKKWLDDKETNYRLNKFSNDLYCRFSISCGDLLKETLNFNSLIVKFENTDKSCFGKEYFFIKESPAYRIPGSSEFVDKAKSAGYSGDFKYELTQKVLSSVKNNLKLISQSVQTTINTRCSTSSDDILYCAIVPLGKVSRNNILKIHIDSHFPLPNKYDLLIHGDNLDKLYCQKHRILHIGHESIKKILEQTNSTNFRLEYKNEFNKIFGLTLWLKGAKKNIADIIKTEYNSPSTETITNPVKGVEQIGYDCNYTGIILKKTVIKGYCQKSEQKLYIYYSRSKDKTHYKIIVSKTGNDIYYMYRADSSSFSIALFALITYFDYDINVYDYRLQGGEAIAVGLHDDM